MKTCFRLPLISLLALGTSCQAPLYYGNPNGGANGGQYVPVQSTANGGQTNSPASNWGNGPSDPSTGAWNSELSGAADRARGGGAWSADPRASTSTAGSRIVAPGSTGVDMPTAPLYGDTGPVRNDPYGATTALDAPARQLEPGGTGRPLMLQQYQAVLEERDALRIEVDALSHQMQLQQLRIQELQGELQGGDMRATGLEQELESMRRRVNEVEAQAEDLSARLVTAQIRRLEAEKDLIQVLIDNQRGQLTKVEMPASAALGNGLPAGATNASGMPMTGGGNQ